jgi:hypothetical protein
MDRHPGSLQKPDSPAAFLESCRGVGFGPAPRGPNWLPKTGKSLFQHDDGGPKIVPTRRQRCSEARIRGNVVFEKLGASVEISDECTDPCHFP